MKKYIKIIALILVAVLGICAVAAGINVLTRKPNEENYVYMLFDSDSSYAQKSGNDGNGITWTVKDDGSIVADGKATKNTYFDIGTINLPKGTYTFTANEDVDRNEFYVVACDVATGTEYWYSDITNSTNGMTQTFVGEKIYNYRIVVLEGTELNNVKFLPCIVEGDTAGDYYA